MMASFEPAGCNTRKHSIGVVSYATNVFLPSVSCIFKTRFGFATCSSYRSLKLAPMLIVSSHCTTNLPGRVFGDGF